MTRLAIIALLLAACGPVPDPKTPTDIDPNDPPACPGAVSAATSCERAAANWVCLECDPSVTREMFVRLCEGHGQLEGASTYQPACQAKARSCQAIEDCRGATP